MTRKPLSFAAAVFVTLLLFCAVTFYYPKYNAQQTEATISWDVAGYYYYLPAFFIYRDAKQLRFTEDIMKRYQPSSQFDMAMPHESGNYVMKYSSGQAVMYAPFFLIAHAYAKNSDFPTDGFSKPYQFAVSYGSLLFCIVGFWLLRTLLLRRFSDGVVAVTLLCIGIGTNYFEYASTSAPMTHGHLFTLYTALLLLTERFYARPSYSAAAGIGAAIGLGMLTRPTEVVAVILPVLWGVGFPLLPALRERVLFLRRHVSKILWAVSCTVVVGSLQLFYWKYATGDWIVYSYGDQGFYWSRPHIIDGLWSYRNGWLTYSPMLYFALVGLTLLWVLRKNFALACAAFAAVFIYVTFAWDIWWYGGSLGQRAMVQAYPVLTFGFAGLVEVLTKRWQRVAFGLIAAFFVYYNAWLFHQAHHGGKYKSDQTTRAYFWKTFLTWKEDPDELKLLDTNESFEGERRDVKQIYANDFEATDSIMLCPDKIIQGQRTACVPPQGLSPEFGTSLTSHQGAWVRANATFLCSPKEWDTWQMPQLLIRFYQGNEPVKDRMIRAHRFMNEGETRDLFIDSRIPENADSVTVHVWNPGQSKTTVFDNVRIEVFR